MKAISAYLHLVLSAVTIVGCLVFLQYCVNLHSTFMLFLGLLALVGLPIAVGVICKRIVDTINN